ncbi:MAG: hypothetical protein R2867_05785 [Caldilineaceae bacterium]
MIDRIAAIENLSPTKFNDVPYLGPLEAGVTVSDRSYLFAQATKRFTAFMIIQF